MYYLDMRKFSNGTRYANNRLYEKKLHQPYDYEHEGLMRHITSPRIHNAKNPILKYMVRYVEQSLVFAMKSVDILQHYFNYNYYNR